jgi:hypothetical protein
LAALDIGVDAGWRRLPDTRQPAGLLLVARLSAWGMKSATVAVERCISAWLPTTYPQLRLLGLVVVAAAPGKPPKLARERLELISGWVRTVGAVYTVPWVSEALGTDDIANCEPLRRAIPGDLTDLVGSIIRQNVEDLTRKTTVTRSP